ncbi:hypothetical protein BH11BAC2_BH11BAC2_15560 [soil metagenome]
MILQSFRKFWWIPVLVILAGNFVLSGKKSGNDVANYSVSARFRTRPAFTAELKQKIDVFCESANCIPNQGKIKITSVSSREDEYNYIDILITSNDSVALVQALPEIEKCIRSDHDIYFLVFSRVAELETIIKSGNELSDKLPKDSTITQFLIRKEVLNLKERLHDVKDTYNYYSPLAENVSKKNPLSEGNLLKRTAVLSIIGVFLMILFAELTRRTKTKND